MSALLLEVNPDFAESNTTVVTRTGGTLSLTPPLDEEYWMFRVAVSPKQAVVAFPKFFTIGVGFQHEEDWNTNLPFSCDANEIYSHIEHNRGDDGITRETCLEAIKLIQAAAAKIMADAH